MAGTAAATLSISRKSAGERKRALPMRGLWLDFAIKSPSWNSSSSSSSGSRNAERLSQVEEHYVYAAEKAFFKTMYEFAAAGGDAS